MKKMILSLFLVFTTIFAVSCGESQEVKDIKNALSNVNADTLSNSQVTITEGFTLPLTGASGVTLAWEIKAGEDNAKIVPTADAAVSSLTIIRPEFDAPSDVKVTLIVTGTKGSSSKTKELNWTVLRMPQPRNLTTIRQIRQLTSADLVENNFIAIDNLVVSGKDQDAYYLSDASGESIQVYGSVPESIAIGQKGKYQGIVQEYFGMYELYTPGGFNATSTGTPVVTPLTTAEFETLVSEFFHLGASGATHADVKAAQNGAQFKTYTAEVKIVRKSGWFGGANYEWVIINKDKTVADVEFATALPTPIPAGGDTATDLLPLGIIYYKCQTWDEIQNLNGEVVTINFQVRELRNNRATAPANRQTLPIYSFGINSLTLTTEQQLKVAGGVLKVADAVAGHNAVVLPTTGLYGTTVSWTLKTVPSGKTASLTDGKLSSTAVENERYQITLEATLSKGNDTKVVDVKTYVGDFQTLASFAEFKTKAGTGTNSEFAYYITGVVVKKLDTYPNIIIWDGTEYLYVYTYSKNDFTKNLVEGSTYKIVGYSQNYNDQYEITFTEEVGSATIVTGAAAIAVPTVIDLNGYANQGAIDADSVKLNNAYVTATGTLSEIDSATDRDGLLTLANGAIIRVYLLNNHAYTNGQSITFTGLLAPRKPSGSTIGITLQQKSATDIVVVPA